MSHNEQQTSPSAPMQRPSNLTPMMEQYWNVKEAHQDCLIFYRMGDFYELFFNDAIVASKVLDITLTKRGKAGNDEDGENNAIPMCGVPFHAYESYMAKLIKNGYKVAICEQIETPEQAKARGGYKALVKRDVIRIVTPGTVTEETLLNARSHNFLACTARIKGTIGLSWADLSTGEIMTQSLDESSLYTTLTAIAPSEVLLPQKMANDSKLDATLGLNKRQINILPDTRFDVTNAEKRLKDIYNVKTLGGFGDFSAAEIAAAGTLADYIALTQKDDIPYFRPIKQVKPHGLMEIDSATRRSLEITLTQNGERNGSLLSTIDNCTTGAGARMLHSMINAPLTHPQMINDRLDRIDFFIHHQSKAREITELLKSYPDMERSLSRLALRRGGPRDLAAIRIGLDIAKQIQSLLIAMLKEPLASTKLPIDIEAATAELDNNSNHGGLINELGNALCADLPFLSRDGGFIQAGYSATLDEYLNLRSNGKKIIAELQAEYAKASGIPTLKIKHNNVLGYFIEASPSHADKALNLTNEDGSNFFTHRQTLGSSVRFTTPKLAELDRKISEADMRALSTELEIYESLVDQVLEHSQTISMSADALAMIDVSINLASLAATRGWCRPVIDDTLAFDIQKGRHPVVEQALKQSQTPQSFVPNDCSLNGTEKLWLLTGPNMAGKSTFLRQNALIVLLAQMGAYVPAESAHIGVVDKLFSRVGASDDLARGHSTFMVEMVETATILNQASERSLVILDEIGRGTATFDGLSIAWACVEHLHDMNKSRGLFATHYHELTTLTNRLDHVCCYTMRVKEWENDIIFMHEVIKGSADRSYGIHVARLAGLPTMVIQRAENVLSGLESDKKGDTLQRMADDLPLFSTLQKQEPQEKPSKQAQELHNKLKQIDPDALTPRDALDLLYELKTMAGK